MLLATLAGTSAAGVFGFPAAASAQELVSISTDPPDCAVGLREVLSLGELEDAGTIGVRPEITRTRDGEFIVASPENRGQLLVYDAEGRFRRTFGRAGDGPGEFRAPGRIRPGLDGTLLILDLGNRRITHVSPGGEALEAVDVRTLQALDFVTIDAGARFVVSGFGVGAAGLSVSTEVVDGDGATLAALGAVPAEPWIVNFFRAPVALDDRGRAWSAQPGAYAFEAWETDGGGDPVVRLAGEADWFDPGPPQPGAPITAPTPSVVMSLRFAEGLMWIATWVADANWRDNADVTPAELQLNRVLDTMLEVIDPANGELVARMRHEEALRITGDERFVFGVREDDVVPRAVLYTPSLDGPGCRSPEAPGM
ncbi:hypothetical protein [Candidatus Palauibacter sp.]